MVYLVTLTLTLLTLACQHGRGPHHKWEKMDKDKNGSVSMEEFGNAHQEMFKKMDANSDGEVTKEEMKAFHHKDCKKDKKSCDSDGQCKMKGDRKGESCKEHSKTDAKLAPKAKS